MEAMQSFPRGLAWWGGRGGRGGAPELSGGARGGRWRLLWRTAAMVVFGRERESEGEEGKNRGRVRESRGGRGVVRGIEGDEKGARQAGREVAWRGGARAPGTLRSPVGEEDDRGGGPGGLGRLLAGPACCGWAAQGKPQVSPSFFYFCFLFFSDICFDLIKY